MSPWSPVPKSYHWLRSALTLNEGVSSERSGEQYQQFTPLVSLVHDGDLLDVV